MSRISFVAGLVCSLFALGVAAQAAQAGTWYIHPRIVNATRSTSQVECGGGHLNWTGCAILDASGVDGGEFVTNHYGATGGRHTLPAFSENIDEPNFDAPNFDEGADGYFVYTMPDGNHYSLVAEDNEEGLFGAFAVAATGCGAFPGESEGFVCLARYPDGTEGDPSNSDFDAEYVFSTPGGAQYTAAGQTCGVPGGSTNYTCAPGNRCRFPAGECSYEGGGTLSATDPSAYMMLDFYDVSSSGPVTITDQAFWSEETGGAETCRLGSTGDECQIITVPGMPNAIQATYSGGGTAQIEVLQEGEVPEVLVDESQKRVGEFFYEAINDAFEQFYGGDDAVGGRRPALAGLRATVGSATRAAPRLRAGASEVTVSYRDSRSASTVLRLERAARGAGWHTLAGLQLRASSDTYWTPSLKLRPPGKRGRRCPTGAARAKGGRCHLRLKLYGHLRHRDRPGANRLRFARVDGRRLAPGRYRLTAVALDGRLRSRPVHTTFTVGD